MKRILYPIKLKPSLKDYIWGGEKLKEEWGKESFLSKIAESWELSDFPKCESTVAVGRYKGLSIHDLKEMFPDILGSRADEFSFFPLLVKLIDASNDLSVQVHPDDDFALINEHEFGKTEFWYIADCDEGSAIYYGFNKDVTEEEIRLALTNNSLESLLNKVEVQKGDSYFVPAGTVHAILKGITVIEVQQSSSITYRLYDYGRKDASGKERELHIEKALQVVNLKKTEVLREERKYDIKDGYKVRRLAECPYFISDEMVVESSAELCNNDSFITITVAEGEGIFDNGFPLVKGDTFLIPAGLKVKVEGKLTFIHTTL